MAKTPGIFLLAGFVLAALPACEFLDTTVAKTVDGRTAYLGPWRIIGERESLIYFLAGTRPDIDLVEMRIRDNNVLQERIHLKGGANASLSTIFNARPSTVFVEYLPASTHYTLSTTQGLGRKSDVLERARKAFSVAETTNAEQRENSAGEYLYVVGDYSGGEKCLFARQGFDLRKAAGAQATPTYNAIVTFQYCAPKTVAEMLDIFDGIRFRNSSGPPP
ncbi:MAG: cellulose biosynthesis protein BcsN [Proteobacteria bacterium]|nr:cellulose biosynthesis protein BcsN [Pseudomonadota bacterium]